MGDYYRMTLWADLSPTPETSAFLERRDFGMFLCGSSSYHDGGTFCSADLDPIAGHRRLALVSQWKTNDSRKFDAEFLPALAALLSGHHDPLVGLLISERQSIQYLWWDGTTIARLYDEDFEKARVAMYE